MSVRESMVAHVGRGEVPGLVTLVSRKGDARVEAIGAKPDAIFRISSMTKPVTAVAAMILVEEGKLELDEAVDRLLPELANRKVLRRLESPLDDTVPAKRPIRVRDLLTFTMGMGIVFAPPGTHPIQRALDEGKLGQGIPSPQTPPAPDEWMRRLGALPLIHQPGERWMYNTGADVLGVLVARASGKTFDTFLRERIFEPLGMKDTGFFVPASKIERLPPSYLVDPDTNALVPYDDPNGQWSKPPLFPSGAAGLVSTADDFFAFGQMMLDRGTRGKTRILSEASVAQMTSDQLSPDVKRASVFVPHFFEAMSWGLGMAVIIGPDESGSQGAFGWDGGLGTSWRSDPHENAVRILLTQRAWTSPAPPSVCRDFWRAAREKS